MPGLAPPPGLEVEGPTLRAVPERTPGEEWDVHLWFLRALWTASPTTGTK
jgi:hypothetical protein